MKIIKPKIIIEDLDYTKIMKNIEKACRTCYRSEDKITKDSYKTLLKNCINRGHESVLEHEKITIQMICDIGVYKDLTRHRHASFSIESTRYCNYNKDKFDNQLHLIEPIFYENSWNEAITLGSAISINEQKSYYWHDCMKNIEQTYNAMIELGSIPDEARMILPHSTAATVTMTANIREWKHILELRCTKHAHPSVQQVMIPLLLYFKEKMPEIFNSIEYNKEFDKSKYAELEIREL